MSANLTKVVLKAVRPLEERIAALELKVAALFAVIGPVKTPVDELLEQEPKKRKPRTKTSAIE